MTNSNKKYTSIQIVPAVKKDGSQYKYVALRGYATRVESRCSQSGNLVVSASIPVDNRNKMLNSALGISLPESETTTWVRVSFWDKIAERFQKFVGSRKSVLIDVFGEIKARPYTTKDGRAGISVEISGYDFWSLPEKKQDSQDAKPSNQTSQVSNSGQFGFDSDGFADLPDDDGDVPF